MKASSVKSNAGSKVVPLNENTKNASSNNKQKDGQMTSSQKRISLNKIQQFEGFNRLKL